MWTVQFSILIDILSCTASQGTRVNNWFDPWETSNLYLSLSLTCRRINPYISFLFCFLVFKRSIQISKGSIYWLSAFISMPGFFPWLQSGSKEKLAPGATHTLSSGQPWGGCWKVSDGGCTCNKLSVYDDQAWASVTNHENRIAVVEFWNQEAMKIFTDKPGLK